MSRWTDLKARFLSLARSKLRLCSANHRAGYFSNLDGDWRSIVWAYSEQETENWHNTQVIIVYPYWNRCYSPRPRKHTRRSFGLGGDWYAYWWYMMFRPVSNMPNNQSSTCQSSRYELWYLASASKAPRGWDDWKPEYLSPWYQQCLWWTITAVAAETASSIAGYHMILRDFLRMEIGFYRFHKL